MDVVADRRTVLTFRGIARTAVTVLVAAVVLLLVGSATGVLPFESVRVPSDSMEPTIRTGDHLLLDRREHPVTAGDIVVVRHDGDLLVKRVVATGGQTVGLEDGVLVVDGQPRPEPYADLFGQKGVYDGPHTVPPGQLWLLGDRRLTSVDSRSFGPVPVSDVAGRVTFVLLPLPHTP
jgi:signal peptidase I